MNRYFIMESQDRCPLNLIRRAILNEDYTIEGAAELDWLAENAVDHHYEAVPLAEPTGFFEDAWVVERILANDHDAVAFRLRFGYCPKDSHRVRCG